jgi:nucleotide-binding universal stress UspA family protein
MDEQRTARTIVALVDERGELEHVRRAAQDVAAGSDGARLILYDGSSASEFTEPVAAPVSAEGVAEEYGSLLAPEDLDKLGRPQLARQVREARAAGIDAWGRLASDHGVGPLMDFARAEGADLVLLPEELGDPSVIDRLRGDTLEDAEEAARVPFQVVPRDAKAP